MAKSKVKSPLIDAVMAADEKKVKQAIDQGADLEAKDPEGRTALVNAALDGEAGILEILIKAGADVNAQDKGGWSALHFAVQEGHLAILKRLLKAGAKPDVQDENGNTPLWRAVFDFEGDTSFIKALRAGGATPGKKNKHGVSAKSLAADLDNDYKGSMD